MKKIIEPEHVIYICDGKSCNKKNKDIKKDIKRWKKEHHLESTLKVIKTHCTDNCKLAPVVCCMPQNKWYSKSEPFSLDTMNDLLGFKLDKSESEIT